MLSIDLQLQQYAEQTLQQGLREARTRCPFDSFTQSCGGPAFAAPAGSAVVEDPRNGQILAMATYPTFDNRWFVEGISNKKIQELYPDADKQAPFVNRAVSSPFQMGSTFKLVHDRRRPAERDHHAAARRTTTRARYQIPNCDVAKFKCIFKNAGLARGSGTISLATALTVSSRHVLLPHRRRAAAGPEPDAAERGPAVRLRLGQRHRPAGRDRGHGARRRARRSAWPSATRP